MLQNCAASPTMSAPYGILLDNVTSCVHSTPQRPLVRDDIYRLAPLPPGFKQVVRACQSDADWQVEGAIKAEMALRRSLSSEIRPELAQQVHSLLAGPQKSLTPTQDLQRIRTEHAQNGLERLFLDHILIHRDTPGQAVQQGLEAAVQERLHAHEQSLQSYMQRKYPKDRRELTQRYHASFSAVPVRGIIAELLNGKMKRSAQARRPRLRPDDDICNLNE